MSALDSWLDRKHARSCERAAETLGADLALINGDRDHITD